MKMFFATDIHGSEICWKKFLNAAAFYKADLVVLGGDVTGKIMVPIVAYHGYWEVTVRGERMRLDTREELLKVDQQLRDRGSYPAIVTREELDQLSSRDAITDRFNAEMTRSLDRWLDMADTKLRGSTPCILNGGNDDIFEIDPILEAAPSVTFAEGKLIDLAGSGYTMVSMGYTNPTPWDTHREAPEEELAVRIDSIVAQVPDMNRTIFNFHAPPYGTGLDEAPELDATMRPTHGGAVMKPVGSTAVRDAIQRYQPPLSVHGHIHESRGVAKLGRTLTVNPGSSYSDGVLQAALIDINPKNGKVKYVLVNG
jgi:Icc-related predicted phosphoesterase